MGDFTAELGFAALVDLFDWPGSGHARLLRIHSGQMIQHQSKTDSGWLIALFFLGGRCIV